MLPEQKKSGRIRCENVHRKHKIQWQVPRKCDAQITTKDNILWAMLCCSWHAHANNSTESNCHGQYASPCTNLIVTNTNKQTKPYKDIIVVKDKPGALALDQGDVVATGRNAEAKQNRSKQLQVNSFHCWKQTDKTFELCWSTHQPFVSHTKTVFYRSNAFSALTKSKNIPLS